MPNIEVLKNVAVAPYLFSEGKFVGGIDKAANSAYGRMEGLKEFRDVQCPIVDAGSSKEGSFLYAGPLWNHFGHILVDSIHRLWGYSGQDAIVFTGVIGLRGVNNASDLLSWSYPKIVDQILEILEIDCPVFIIRETTSFEELFVPEAGSVWRKGSKQFYGKYLDSYQEKVAYRSGGIKVPRKLYYSRNHMLSDGGIIGSSYFQKQLSFNGFELCKPESLSLIEQFSYLLNADSIVFDEGSSIHLTEMFSRVKPNMYMFPRRPGDRIFKAALGTRHNLLENLVADENIRLLKDKNGNAGTPAAISYYSDPKVVYQRLVDLGLAGGKFDMNEFILHERNDLLSCKTKSVQLRDERLAILDEERTR